MRETRPSNIERRFFPASPIQLQFWILQELFPDSPAYHVPSVSLIEGPLDPPALETALNAILRRQPIFRSRFEIDESGKLLQEAVPWERASLTPEEGGPFPGAADMEKAVKAAALKEIESPFDLRKGPPIRFRLYRRGAESHILAINAHHIVFDLVTKDLFADALAAEYRAALLGISTADLPHQATYDAYSIWYEQWLRSEDFHRMEIAWRKYLDGVDPSFQLPAAGGSNRGSRASEYYLPMPVNLNAGLADRVEAFCRKETVTPYLVLLTAWAVTLARLSGQTKLSIGVPLTNRRRPEFQQTMGCFVNSLPLIFDVADHPTLGEALRRIRMGMLALHRMQEMPYFNLVQLIRREGRIRGNSLYRVGFTFEHPMRLRLDGLQVDPWYIHARGGQVDLFATFWQKPGSLTGVIKYDGALLDPGTVKHIGERLVEAVEEICERPEKPVMDSASRPGQGVSPIGRAEHLPVADSRPEEETPSIVLASSFTSEILQEFFEFWFSELGWHPQVRFAPFNQVYQELLRPSSVLRSNRRGYNVILIRVDDLLDGGAESLTSDAQGHDPRLARLTDELLQAAAGAAPKMSVPLSFVLCPSSPAGEEILKAQKGVVEQFLDSLRSIPNVTVLTHQDVMRRYPVLEYDEPFGEKLGHIPYTRPYFAALATTLVRSFRVHSHKPIKAMAIDCDGTLWKGVAAEEGATEVTIGPSQRSFQNFLLEQSRAGVMLCLCSKNLEDDVWAVFDRHPDMVLRREHVTAWKINWEPKYSNILALAGDINIGIDAFAFLDDSPLERAEMSAHCPSVFCLEFPEAWEERTAWLEHVWALDQGPVTAEDRQRREYFRSENRREALKKSTGTLREFLEKLELQVDLHPAAAADFERLAQLSVRTNQFNTTTLRLNSQEVARYAATPGFSAHVARVRDRYGDYGLVGGMLTRATKGSFRVEGMFLSCRALGRGVEYKMASYLGEIAKDLSCSEIIFPLRRTDRNEPARAFLARLHEFCGGGRDEEGGLHLAPQPLAAFRDEAQPTSEEAAAEASPQAPAPVHDQAASEDRALLLDIAGAYRSVEAILDAAENWTREQRSRRGRRGLESPAAPPETEKEQLIADLWKSVLGLADVNTRANIFDIGGTSLLMARIAIELRRKHDVDVSMMDMFQYPTIYELARHLDQKDKPKDVDHRAMDAARRQRLVLHGSHLPEALKRLKDINR